MPEISRFFGIVITMLYDDHGPPHFHARHGQARARVRLAPIEALTTSFPLPTLRLVIRWATLHEAELLENWRRLRAGMEPLRIPPLD